MSLQKYKTILTEAHIRDGGYISKLEANYTNNGIGDERCQNCENFLAPARCEIVEGIISPEGWCKFFDSKHALLGEKWGTTTTVNPEERGKYKDKSKAELLQAYNALKKSGPHSRGSPEYGRMRELAFAIRAKSGWGKVK